MNAAEALALQNLHADVSTDDMNDKLFIVLGFDYNTTECSIDDTFTLDDCEYPTTVQSITQSHKSTLLLQFGVESMPFIDVGGAVRRALLEVFIEAHAFSPSPELIETLFTVVQGEALEKNITLYTKKQPAAVEFKLDADDYMKSMSTFTYGESKMGYTTLDNPLVNNPVKRLMKACPALETEVPYPSEAFKQDKRLGWEIGYTRELRYVIMDLNDRLKWPREKIADWLETLDLDITVNMEES